MKKFIAVLLCITMILPFGILAASAQSAPQENTETAELNSDALKAAFADEDSLIIFVTGIGQSHSYLFDASYTADGAFANGSLQDYENYSSLIAEGKYTSSWNLFANDFSEALKEPETLKAAAGVVGGLIASLFLRHNLVNEDAVSTLLESLFRFNLVDENGNLNERVVTPRYTCSVADYPYAVNANGEYTSEAKNCFYGSIPCADIAKEYLGDRFEEYLYCFNYSAFSYTSNNVDGLHEFIETALANNTVGATKAVLVPMSMGASVVSAYLAKYPSVNDNHVKRVVSVVGCWNGSDIVYDLLKQNYADNSADLVYNGLVADMVGYPAGYLVNIALRLFSKAALRSIIDEVLGIFVDKILLNTPSLMALVPSYDYNDIRGMITSDSVLKETDAYYEAQSTLKDRMSALENDGVTFSFIAGYGLKFGEQTGDYKMFGFLNSAAKTNSDEIINISSTAPGTSFVTAGTAYANAEGRTLSPDGSLDISTAWYPESTWYFSGQKHELEHNNTAIKLALQLAVGNIKTVSDCDTQEDSFYFPQFNDSRNLKSLRRSYLPDMQNFIASSGYVLNEEQTALYNEVIAMTNSTINNRAADDELLDEFRLMLIDMGVYEASAAPSAFDDFIGGALSKNNDLLYRIYGAKGFLDFCQK